MYNPQVMDHYENPRNVGTLNDADGVGIVGTAASGEMIKVSIQVLANKIADVRFKAFGCPTVIAASSVMTELIKGIQIEDALKITNRHIETALGGLPPDKGHYAIDAEKAARCAIYDYISKIKIRNGGEHS